MRPGRVVAPMSVNRGRSRRMLRAVGPLPSTTSSGEVLERGVQDLLDGARHPVDLVDEQHVAVAEVREDRREVGGALERGAARGLEARPHLGGHDLRERGLAQAGRPAEQQVVHGLAAVAGAVEQERRAAP